MSVADGQELQLGQVQVRLERRRGALLHGIRRLVVDWKFDLQVLIATRGRLAGASSARSPQWSGPTLLAGGEELATDCAARDPWCIAGRKRIRTMAVEFAPDLVGMGPKPAEFDRFLSAEFGPDSTEVERCRRDSTRVRPGSAIVSERRLGNVACCSVRLSPCIGPPRWLGCGPSPMLALRGRCGPVLTIAGDRLGVCSAGGWGGP